MCALIGAWFHDQTSEPEGVRDRTTVLFSCEKLYLKQSMIFSNAGYDGEQARRTENERQLSGRPSADLGCEGNHHFRALATSLRCSTLHLILLVSLNQVSQTGNKQSNLLFNASWCENDLGVGNNLRWILFERIRLIDQFIAFNYQPNSQFFTVQCETWINQGL